MADARPCEDCGIHGVMEERDRRRVEDIDRLDKDIGRVCAKLTAEINVLESEVVSKMPIRHLIILLGIGIPIFLTVIGWNIATNSAIRKTLVEQGQAVVRIETKLEQRNLTHDMFIELRKDIYKKDQEKGDFE
jgi:hypothetical protein